MKKLILFLLIAAFITTFQISGAIIDHSKFSITIGAGTKNISEDIFETVYGSGNIAYSLDLAFKLGGSLEAFVHTDYLKAEGELEYDPKKTTLTIMPAEVGLRILLGKGKFKPYLGIGAGYYMFKEENFIGTVDDNSIGFFGEGGFRYYFGKLFIDLKLKYIQLKYEVSGTDIDLGGLAYFGGIGIRF
ncbi:MAG: outer membrane beta-barrel protein [Acidobacteriota bacterium]